MHWVGPNSTFHWARAYFLSFVDCALLLARTVFCFFSNGDSLLLKALVFFCLRSLGRYLFPLAAALAVAILFSERTVKTLAIAFLTCLILLSFTWGWEDTLLTLRPASSLRCLVSSSTSLGSSSFLRLWALTLCIL